MLLSLGLFSNEDQLHADRIADLIVKVHSLSEQDLHTIESVTNAFCEKAKHS